MKQIILLSALSIMTAAVNAEPGQAVKDPSFNQIDADQNGMISKSEAEFSKTLPAVFDQADTNQDGMLDSDEFAKIEFQEKR